MKISRVSRTRYYLPVTTRIISFSHQHLVQADPVVIPAIESDHDRTDDGHNHVPEHHDAPLGIPNQYYGRLDPRIHFIRWPRHAIKVTVRTNNVNMCLRARLLFFVPRISLGSIGVQNTTVGWETQLMTSQLCRPVNW